MSGRERRGQGRRVREIVGQKKAGARKVREDPPVYVPHLHLQLNVGLECLVLGAHAQRHAQDLACCVQALGTHLQLGSQRPHLAWHRQEDNRLGKEALSASGNVGRHMPCNAKAPPYAARVFIHACTLHVDSRPTFENVNCWCGMSLRHAR